MHGVRGKTVYKNRKFGVLQKFEDNKDIEKCEVKNEALILTEQNKIVIKTENDEGNLFLTCDVNLPEKWSDSDTSDSEMKDPLLV